MGKGADGGDCERPVSMADVLADPAEASTSDERLAAELAKADSVFDKASLEIQKAIQRSEAIEKFEEKFATETIQAMAVRRADGASEEEIREFIRQREEELLVSRRGRMGEEITSRTHEDNVSPPDLEEYRENLETGAEQASLDYTEVWDNSDEDCPPELRFQREFLNSADFQENLRRILADKTYHEPDSKAVSEKDMELAYREAMRATLDIRDDAQTLAYWTSPETGTQYQIEVLQEHSNTALFDIVMMAREVGAADTEVYTMQWKSYQTNDKESHTPERRFFPKRRSGMIRRLTSLPDEDKTSLKALVATTQMRFLATNTYADTSSYNQKHNNRTKWISYDTKVSRPEAHRAIYSAKPEDIIRSFVDDFEPAIAKSGKNKGKPSYRTFNGQPVALLKAKVPVKDDQGSVLYHITLGSQMKAKIDPKTGKLLLDKQGNPQIVSGGSGNISVDIPNQGWYPLQRASAPSRGMSQSIQAQRQTT